MAKSNQDQEYLDATDGEETALDSALAAPPKKKSGKKKPRLKKSAAILDTDAPDIVCKKEAKDLPVWKFRVQSMNREKIENPVNGELGPLLYRAADLLANSETPAIAEYCKLYRLNSVRHQFRVVCLQEAERFEASMNAKKAKMIAKGWSEKKMSETLDLMAS